MTDELTTLQAMVLEQEIVEIGKQIMELHRSYKTALTEAVTDFYDPSKQDPDDINFMFDEAKKRFQAARQGLALTNKLTDPQQRAQNKSRVMGNLNRLRAIFYRLAKEVDMKKQELADGNGNDGQRQGPAPVTANPASNPAQERPANPGSNMEPRSQNVTWR